MPTLVHCTKLALLTEWRRRFKAASGLVALRLAWRLQQWINEGFVTDVNLKTMFAVDDVQLVTLKVRIANRANQYEAVMSDAGE